MVMIITIIIATLTIHHSTQVASLALGTDDSEESNLSNSQQQYYQPSLIGFRCENKRELTPEGVSIIEANVPVTITLFGESFTRDTIVAFTTEFQPEVLVNENGLEKRANLEQVLLKPSGGSKRVIRNVVASGRDGAKEGVNLLTKGENKKNLTNNQNLTARRMEFEGLHHSDQSKKQRKFEHRLRTINKSYDCTDYDRVISYRLKSEDILSPNVARLTVSLPELDMGNLYYFCLKQPKLTLIRADINNTANQNLNQNQQPYSHYNQQQQQQQQQQQLIWVHQGDDPWVSLRVEEPALTVTTDCILMLFLLFLSAVTSGLNLGLMSLDMNELTVISSCGDPSERAYARTIAPLRKRGNYLLCSLLLGNVMVNATLTVILEQLTSGVVAVIGSTLAIVVLGEIVPQAFCARQGLAVGAKTIYLTYAFMIITFPLSYPISLFLDYFLGQEEGHVYDRERLMEFIRITGHHTQLDSEEVAIISGAMKIKNIKVHEIMTRIEDVFMLPIDCKLDRETIKRIIEKGYSRIPVYEFDDRKQITALILAKDLALLDPDDHTPIASMLTWCKHPLIFIDDDTTLDVALNEFKTGKSHMAVVRQIYDDGDLDKYYEAIGVVTLEDVIEEVLQVEINDETDTLSDNRRKRRRADAQVHLAIEAQQQQKIILSQQDQQQLDQQLAQSKQNPMGEFEPPETNTNPDK